jgi:DNA-binding response OmpR family regulator
MAKILIIDDDQQICRMLGEFLKRQGHVTSAAFNGQDGMLAATSSIPDLIICDLEMPDLDGLGVVTRLREHPKLGEVPVVFLSGCTDRSRIRTTMNLGADDFISKPAQLPEILEAVNARLARRQKQIDHFDQQIEQAAQAFVGIIHDLNKDRNAAEIRWLAHPGASPEEKQNRIIQRVRQSLAGEKPVANRAPTPNTLLINTPQRQQFLKLSEVKAFLAYGEYSNIHWGKDQHMMFRKPLKQWELELPAEQFCRVHRQAIVNLSHLDFVEKAEGGKLLIHLRDFKQVIPVSQRETGAFNRRLKAYNKQSPQP